MSAMPSSIWLVDTACVELPSPESMLDMPTIVMPTCDFSTEKHDICRQPQSQALQACSSMRSMPTTQQRMPP